MPRNSIYYDPDGNMTSDGRGIYKYDSHRMTEAVMEDGRKLICRYDAEGLRHETEENGRLVLSDSESARTYYHYASDSIGSITHVIAGNEFGNEETNGDINSRILCRYEYDAFGNTISAEETITNRYGFTGEMHDDITDMYYLRARYYAPCMGRFTQADTYHGDGLNLYVYAGNNPVKYVDPSGHSCKNNNVNSGLKEFDIVPYGEFKNYPYDNLTGHELLQNVWLEANGKIVKRGQGLSKDNPAIALYENPIHKYISAQQKTLKLNKRNLAGISWRQNVLTNINIMKSAGVPREKILELAKRTKQFAIDNKF